MRHSCRSVATDLEKRRSLALLAVPEPGLRPELPEWTSKRRSISRNTCATARPTCSWPSSRSGLAPGPGHRATPAEDWARLVCDLVDGRYPEAERIVLVMDQLNTHTPASLYEAFTPTEAKRLAEQLEIHSTPKHGSWLNMAEIELSVLARLPEPTAGRPAILARGGGHGGANAARPPSTGVSPPTMPASSSSVYPAVDP